MKHFDESIGQKFCRPAHKPLSSFIELCEMLGVTQQKMAWAMKKGNPPKPKLDHRNSSTVKNRWYDKDEFIAWWKSLNQQNG